MYDYKYTKQCFYTKFVVFAILASLYSSITLNELVVYKI